jgi:hypothetical protein
MELKKVVIEFSVGDIASITISLYITVNHGVVFPQLP